MLHEENENKSDNNNNNKSRYTMKQVEMNTIAAGFGYVSTKASLLHRYIYTLSFSFITSTDNYFNLKRNIKMDK